jgi:hypothetical protein
MDISADAPDPMQPGLLRTVFDTGGHIRCVRVSRDGSEAYSLLVSSRLQYTQTRRLVDQPADHAYINYSMSAWKGKASNSEIWAQVHTRAAGVVNQGVRIFTGTPSISTHTHGRNHARLA